MPTKEDEIGALWLRKNRSGSVTFLSGKINGEEVVIFSNKFKTEGGKQPDYRVYRSTPRDAD